MIFFSERTITTPEVDFQYDLKVLSMKGEAYPENATLFFTPILTSLEEFLASIGSETVEVNIDLTYFNSAATKMLFKMFALLNASAASGNTILLNWYHDAEDDTSIEFGEDVRDEFPELEFSMVAL